jgi:hypothetical protein
MGTSAQLVGALRRSFNIVAHPHARDRDEPRRLAEGQAALRRVARLVARGALPADVLEAVIAEVGRLGDADAAALSRYETDDGHHRWLEQKRRLYPRRDATPSRAAAPFGQAGLRDPPARALTVGGATIERQAA